MKTVPIPCSNCLFFRPFRKTECGILRPSGASGKFWARLKLMGMNEWLFEQQSYNGTEVD